MLRSSGEATKKSYNQHQVNNKILIKHKPIRSELDLLGPFDRYRDENYKIYLAKSRQFEACAKAYNKLNEEVLVHGKAVRLTDRDEKLPYDFLNSVLGETEQTECSCKVAECVQIDEPLLRSPIYIRRRSSRPANEQIAVGELGMCTLEPWFVRYVVLGRFVQAARKVVLWNRLLKNLAILRKLDRETVEKFERDRPVYDNVTYAEVFDKFI